MRGPLEIVATCALGLEELLAAELAGLGIEGARQRGAVLYRGGWDEVYRSNWRLRTANRVLVALDRWPAADGDALAAGARALVESPRRSWAGLSSESLFQPHRTLALRATSSSSQIRDVRWVALRVKDGLVDAQRALHGKRSSVDRRDPDLPLRVWLRDDRATLLLDTSGEPLDRRGYRLDGGEAPVREPIAAACVLASGWEGAGVVVDPMCGSGTLLAEAAGIALGRAAGEHRAGWAFERFPGFDGERFQAIRREPRTVLNRDLRLVGVDRSRAALAAARANLGRAGLLDRVQLVEGDGLAFDPPPGPGLLLVNPPYDERVRAEPEQWRRLGDLFKQRYAGWRVAVLAGDRDRGKHIGLRPSFRLPVRNGPLDARILGFTIYEGSAGRRGRDGEAESPAKQKPAAESAAPSD